jgi:hypothetical protein
MPGWIIRPGGRIIRPPRFFFLKVAAAHKLIDRGRRSYNNIHDSKKSKEWRTKHQEHAWVKSHPRDRKIPASIAKMAW